MLEHMSSICIGTVRFSVHGFGCVHQKKVVSITERMRNECDSELEGTVMENKQLQEEFVTLSEAHHKLLVQISNLRGQYVQ